MRVVYLIHFERPYKHARHYVGSTNHMGRRQREHGTPSGARLLQVVAAAGIRFEVVRTWPGDRALERKIKSRKKASYFCPLCNPVKERKNHA